MSPLVAMLIALGIVAVQAAYALHQVQAWNPDMSTCDACSAPIENQSLSEQPPQRWPNGTYHGSELQCAPLVLNGVLCIVDEVLARV